MKSKEKILIILSLFLFLHAHSISQNNIKLYYKNINKAELAICDEKYDDAVKCYDKAFKNHFPFINDLVLAYKINMFSNHYMIAEKYAILLSQLEIEPLNLFPIDTFQNYLFYEHLKIIQDTTKSILNQYIKSRFDSLVAKDQFLDQPSGRGGTWELNQSLVKKNDSINLKTLILLFESYPNLNEIIIGKTYHSTTSLILTHNKSNIYHIKDILHKAVLNGNFDARIFGSIMDEYQQTVDEKNNNITTMIYGYSYLGQHIINNTLFIYIPAYKKQLNKNRKEIYLENYNNHIRKVIYQFSHSEYNFYMQFLLGGSDDELKTSEEQEKKAFDCYNGKDKMRLIYYSK
jgi:hypothetical protein